MRRAILVLAVLLALPVSVASGDWTTYRHDAARTGIDPDSTNPVAPAQAWQSAALDGKIFAEPLVLGSTVYEATENDTIYALDAATGGVRWSRHLATPEPQSSAPCGDIGPTIGITSTPVIDPATNRIYAVGAVAGSGGGVSHELFALDATTGTPISGFPENADPPKANPAYQLQRPALALQSGRIVVGYGGNDGDCGTYWGWLVSLPTNPPGAAYTFQADSTGTHHGGAIWGGGSGPPVDAAGHLWAATGNGYSSGTFDYAESVISFNANLGLVGFWAPTNWSNLDSSDADIGSSEPALIGSSYVFQAGKDQNAYLINAANPGGISPPAAELPGFCSGQSFGGAVYNPFTATIYAPCTAGLKAIVLGGGAAAPTLTAKAGFSAPSAAIGPPILAAGLVWVVGWNNAQLYGLNPATGAVAFQAPLPSAEHFAIPSAGGGRLFVGAGDQVVAFTIASAPAVSPGAPPPGNPSPKPVAPRIWAIRLGSARVRSGGVLVLGLTSNESANVGVTIVRRARHPGRPILSRSVHLHGAGRHRWRLRLKGVRPGRYVVGVALGRVRRASLALQVLPAR